MFKFKKILFFILTFLTFIIVIELCYLFFRFKIKSIDSNQSLNNQIDLNKSIRNFDNTEKKLSIHPSRLNTVKNLTNTSKARFYILLEFSTKIKEVYPAGKKIRGYFYPFVILYNDFKAPFVFDQKMKDRIKVTISKNNKEFPATFNDLRIGDYVRVREIHDYSVSLEEAANDFSKEILEYNIIIFR